MKRGLGTISARSLISEAWRNLASGTSLALLLSLSLALIVGALGELENKAVSTLDLQATAFTKSGASTFTITSERNIDASACERLAGTGLVDRAGASRQARSASIATLPDTAVQVYEVSPGFLSFLDATKYAQDAGVLISEALAQEILPEPAIRAEAGVRSVPPLTITGVYRWPDDGRSTDFQYAVVAPVPTNEAFDQCWIRAKDPEDKPLDLLLSTLVRAPENPSDAVPAQLNQKLGEVFTARTDFATRGTRHSWAMAAIACALITMTGLRRRAAEITNAKDCGISPLALAVQMALETTAWAVVGASIALAALTISIHLQSAYHPWTLLALDLRIAAGAVTGALLGSALGVATVVRKPTEFYLRIR